LRIQWLGVIIGSAHRYVSAAIAAIIGFAMTFCDYSF
jgi:uncharacterized membrane protein YraQ (UPF0718 family)